MYICLQAEWVLEKNKQVQLLTVSKRPTWRGVDITV